MRGYIHTESVRGVTVAVVGNSDLVQIQNEAVCFSHKPNTLWKGMNLITVSSVMGE